VPIAVVGASSNRVCVTCPIVAMVRDVRVLIADVGAGRNRTCAMCPIVTTDEACPLLLGHHSSNGTAPMSHLPLLHRVTNCCYRDNIVIVGDTQAHGGTVRGPWARSRESVGARVGTAFRRHTRSAG
jgi:hypothetical protein